MDLDFGALGSALRQSRITARLTQQELANMAGVSRATICNLETGRVPSARIPHTLREVTDALHWPPAKALRILRGQEAPSEPTVPLREISSGGTLLDAGVLDLSEYDRRVQANFVFVCRGEADSLALVDSLRATLVRAAESWRNDHSTQPG
ncbi:helix-turn-helix domain-containing protein [Rhodococcus qingshengii]|uniref:helix-turn-helix domain-containing protein n=1 Tax=Rhodococcus qingshengii TaxID=334542 RepID=UPI0035DB80CC